MKNITFINAGAGSGKTHNLIEKLTKWIEEGNDPSQVLLTTFTRKAATEIRERAQEKLLEARKFSEANKLQEAAMGTVHSIGYRFIKKYWYLLDISPEIREISEDEQDIFFSRAIASVPNHEELQKLAGLCHALDFRKAEDGNFKIEHPLQWKDDVLTIMKEALVNKIDLENDASSLEKSLEKVNKVFGRSITSDNLLGILKKIQSVLEDNPVNGRSAKDYKDICNECPALIKRVTDGEHTMRLVREVVSIYERISPGKKLNSAIYDFMRNQFPEFAFEETQLLNEAITDYTKLVFDIAQRSLKDYQEFKQQYGLVDYTDMEVHFLNLLDEEIVRDEVRETIKLVMVDEFQDSNPIQLSIFLKLSDLVEKSYWVGDPKQSIYEFRGADPELIEKVIHEFTKENHDSSLNLEILKTSWRSTPDLVDFTNKVFSERMKDQVSPMHLEREAIFGDNKNTEFNDWKNQVVTTPLKAEETIALIPNRLNHNHTNLPSICFWHNLKQDQNEIKNGSKPTLRGALAQEIKSLLEEKENHVFCKRTDDYRRLRASDICILTRANHEVEAIANDFEKENLPANASLPGLSKTFEYRIIQDIVTLFFDKQNALALTELSIALEGKKSVTSAIEERLKFVSQLPDKAEENYWEEANKWLEVSEFREAIENLIKQSNYLSVSHVFQKIVNHINLFHKVLPFDKSQLRKSNLLQIIELAKEYEEYANRLNQGASLAGVFSYIKSNSKKDKQAVPTNQEGVNVMTYHKSKGIEWPVVILLDVDDDVCDKSFYKKSYFKTRVKNTAEFDVNNPLKDRYLELYTWPFGGKDPSNSFCEKIDQLEDHDHVEQTALNEQSRLMYVGKTRARDHLIMATCQKENLSSLENILPDWKMAEAMQNHQLETTVESTLDLFDIGTDVFYKRISPADTDEENHEVTGRKLNEIPELYFRKVKPATQSSPYILNPSKQPKLDGATVGKVTPLHERLNLKAKKSSDLGDALHALLYLKDRKNFAQVAAQSATLQKLEISPDDFVDNTNKFNEYIQSNFQTIQSHRELYLELLHGNQLASGEADLLLEQEKGLILIDYKTFPGNRDQINDPQNEFYAGKYSGQLDLYAKMAEHKLGKPVEKRLIYYVVQGVMVELQ